MGNLSQAELIAERQARAAAGMDDDLPAQCPECQEEALEIVDKGRKGEFWWCHYTCRNCGYKEQHDNF